MSVANKNPFAILGDDGGDAPAPRSAPKAAAAPAAAPARTVVGAGGNNPKNRAPRGGGAPRADRSAETGGASQEQRDSRSGRGRSEGGERGRGQGRGRGGRGRGRAFDRHSQTNRVDSEKAIAQAWGGEDGVKELEVEEKAEKDAQVEGADAAAAEAWGSAEPVKAAEAPVSRVEEEEEDKTMTLDEYLASKAGKKLNVESKAPRQVNNDESAYAKLTKHQKEEAEYFAATKAQKTKARTQKEGKQFLEIEQTFSQPATAQRGGRGGREGGRGRGAPRGERGAARGRGGRGGRGGNASVNLSDNAAFPSLA